jgi:putative transposase
VAAGLPVSRFGRLAGIPERTYRYRLARHRAGQPIKGPWPTPAVDAIEAVAAKYAEAWPAWGHRKIAALMRVDGHAVSISTVHRALRRHGLLLPVGYRADRKSWAVLRRRVFLDPPTERNRVWQTDFSEFETSVGGIWRICAVIEYATKYCLAATLSPTSRAVDALACLHAQWLKPNACSESMTCVRTGVSWTSSTPTVWLSATLRPRSRSCPTMAAPSMPAPSPAPSPATTRYYGTSAPASDRRRPTASSSGSSARLSMSAATAASSATATPSPWRSTATRQIYNTIRPHQALSERTPRNADLDGS